MQNKLHFRTRWLHSAFCTLILLFSLGVGNVWGAIAAGTYELCTSTSDLVASGHYIIASSKSNGTAYAIALTSKANNRATTEVTVSSEKITVAANSTVMTFTLGGDNTNGWTFSTDNYAGTAGMLAATSSSSNRLGVVASPGNNGKWAITFSSGLAKPVAKGTNTYKYMKYNYNNGTPIFNCYNSNGSESVYIYKLAASCDDITPTLSYTSTNLTIGGRNSSSPTLNKDGSSGAVTWSSDDEDVATVNSSGVVTPVGTGTCNITASIAAGGGKCAGEVSVEFTVTRTITYYVGSTSYTVGGIDGETLVSTLPASPSSCDAVNYPYFYGWKNGSISGSTTTAPTILASEVVNSSTAANTYYAVFTDVEPANGWEPITSLSAGDVLVLCNAAGTYEMSGINASNYGDQASCTEGSPAATYALTVEAGSSSGTWSFKHGSVYLSWSSGNSLTTSETKNAASSWNVSINGSTKVATITNSNTSGSDTRYLQYNSGSSRFACYKNTMVDGKLYKQTGGGTANYITTCCTQLGTINGSFL